NMDGAVGVGAQDADVRGFESIEKFWAWMAVRIVFAGRDERELRMYGGEEVGCRRVFAPVVSDLQNLRMQAVFRIFGEDRAFGGLCRVAWKQKCAAAVAQAQNERVVVFWSGCDFVGSGFRPEEVGVDAIPMEVLPADFVADSDAVGLRKCFQVGQRGRVNFA